MASSSTSQPSVPSPQTVTPLTFQITQLPEVGFGANGTLQQAMPAFTDIWDYPAINRMMTNSQIAMYPSMVNAQLGMMPAMTQADIAANTQWQNAMFPLGMQQQGQLFDLGMQQSAQAFPQLLEQTTAASRAAFDEALRQAPAAFGENMRQSEASMAHQWGTDSIYTPYYTWLNNEAAMAANPQFYPMYTDVANAVGSDLAAGYTLGDDLSREIEQSIRGSQTARGNWLGPAPTAEEAFGKGSAMIDLRNQRIGNAQNFLNSKQITDLWGSMGLSIPRTQPAGASIQPMSGMAQVPQMQIPQMGVTAMGSASGMAPSTGFTQNPGFDISQGLSLYGTNQAAVTAYTGQDAGFQSDYNNALISATSVNNEGTWNQYDRTYEQYLYEQAVANGLYSTPSVGGSSGMGSMIGAGIGAVGAIGGGLASAGAFGGAAAGAAAAICWLARKVIPSQWREFREFLFTEAPAWFRTKYIYGARQMANNVSEDEISQLKSIMLKLIS